MSNPGRPADAAPTSDRPAGTPLRFSDIVVGAEYWSRAHTMTLDEVVTFARQWDPQYFHTDEEKAANSMFGRVSASGLHSFALCHRLFDDLGLFREIAIAGTGIEQMRWRRPVYPGDTLRARGTITGIDYKDRGRAVVATKMELINQEDVAALVYTISVLVRTEG
jgi:acyl dehydratase